MIRVPLFDICSDAAVSLGEAFNGGDGSGARQSGSSLLVFALGGGVSADGASEVEGVQGLVELPTRLAPSQPTAPFVDEAEIVLVTIGEAKRQVVIAVEWNQGRYCFAKRGAWFFVLAVVIIDPCGYLTGDVGAEHFPHRGQAIRVLAGAVRDSLVLGGFAPIPPLWIAGGFRNRLHEQLDLVDGLSGAEEESADGFCGLVARACSGPIAREEGGRGNQGNAAVQILPVDGRRVACFLPGDGLVGVLVGRAWEYRLGTLVAAADAELGRGS